MKAVEHPAVGGADGEASRLRRNRDSTQRSLMKDLVLTHILPARITSQHADRDGYRDSLAGLHGLVESARPCSPARFSQCASKTRLDAAEHDARSRSDACFICGAQHADRDGYREIQYYFDRYKTPSLS